MNNQTRRQFIKSTAVIGTTLALGGTSTLISCVGNDQPEQRNVDPKTVLKVIDPNAPKPNVIIINTDDLGYGDLSCYGSRAVKTPNLDRLAREGMRFTDGYSCNALCSPSRFGLLTGRYAQRRGLDWPIWEEKALIGQKAARAFGHILGKMGLTDMGKESDIKGIPANEITIAESLRLVGYRTALVGKWHLGDFPVLTEYHPMKHGFDEFYGVPHSNGMTPFPLYRGYECLEEDIKGQSMARLAGLYTDESIKFIEKNRTNPFFLYLAHNSPHRPLFASDEFRNTSKGGLYGDVVEEMDWYVGKLMSALSKNGLEKNTVVIFTSDNGPWYNGSTGGLRGGKGQSFEGGFRVPFIVRWPGHIKANTSCNESVMNIDFFPTLLKMAGVSNPSDRIIDGKDISGLLLGSSKTTPHNALFFYHHNELEGVRVGKWKYYRKINLYKYPAPVNKKFASIAGGKLSSWPLIYDMEIDPMEAYNLADNEPELIKKMEKIMTDWEIAMNKNPVGWLNLKS